MNILVVDDDVDDLWIFTDAVKFIDPAIVCHPVTGCKEAFERLENDELPDVIFLDINMPVMNGIDGLKTIRRNKKYDHISITVMSTNILDEHSAACQKYGVGWFQKPSNFADLVKHLRAVLDSLHFAAYDSL